MENKSENQNSDYIPVNERLKKHKETTVDDMFTEIENDLKKDVENIKNKYKKNEE